MDKKRREMHLAFGRILEAAGGKLLGREKPAPMDPDRKIWCLYTPSIRFDAVAHSKGVAVEAWVGGERVCSMDAGCEVELVLYALLCKQRHTMEQQLKELNFITAKFDEVRRENPEAWKRFKAVGKKKREDDGRCVKCKAPLWEGDPVYTFEDGEHCQDCGSAESESRGS